MEGDQESEGDYGADVPGHNGRNDHVERPGSDWGPVRVEARRGERPSIGPDRIANGCGPALQPQISFAMATAVSAMRFEKPHSLSYQDITRTKLPSITLVWSMWKMDEAGWWLKSMETFGSLV
jgi:hypothetical protein